MLTLTLSGTVLALRRSDGSLTSTSGRSVWRSRSRWMFYTDSRTTLLHLDLLDSNFVTSFLITSSIAGRTVVWKLSFNKPKETSMLKKRVKTMETIAGYLIKPELSLAQSMVAPSTSQALARSLSTGRTTLAEINKSPYLAAKKLCLAQERLQQQKCSSPRKVLTYKTTLETQCCTHGTVSPILIRPFQQAFFE